MHKKVDAKGKIDDDDTKAEKKDVGGEPKKRKTTDDSNVDEESKKNVDDKPKKNIAEGNQDEIVKKLAKDVARPKKEIPFNEDEIDAVVKKGLKQDAVKKDLDDEDDAAQ
ncbi:CIC11C00000004682 [Sungouiella intermedia]|uniref:CIC11C00000004682 n=1 Tax=Sungouiella intermedia TaxID=45354 RepID=A0A1L0BE08_9ASCO|nr:CIC11C00000004682 [[Candida] intermedia]